MRLDGTVLDAAFGPVVGNDAALDVGKGRAQSVWGAFEGCGGGVSGVADDVDSTSGAGGWWPHNEAQFLAVLADAAAVEDTEEPVHRVSAQLVSAEFLFVFPFDQKQVSRHRMSSSISRVPKASASW